MTFELRLPIPFPPSEICLSYLNEVSNQFECVDTNMEIVNQKVNGSYIWFARGKTPHFSKFTVIQTNVTSTNPGISQTTLIGVGVGLAVLVGVALVCSVFIIFYKRKQMLLHKQVIKAEREEFDHLQNNEDIYFKVSDIQIQNEIGSGNFGSVFKALYLGNEVALKKLNSFHDVDFVREVSALKKLRHPNIVW